MTLQVTSTPKPKPPGMKPGPRPYAPKTPEIRQAVLDFLKLGHTYKVAAEKAGTARRTVMDWRGADPEYAKACDEAYEEGTDVIEEEARRRAVEGNEEVTTVDVSGDKSYTSVTSVNKKSDALITLMLAGRRPEKFSKNKLELTGPDGGPVTVKAEIEFIEPPAKGGKK